MPIDLSRRDVLRLGLVVSAGAGLAACTTSSSSGTPTQSDPGGPEDPDRALRAEVATDEARLTALYAAAATVLTGTTATRTAALGERHSAYRAAVEPASASTSPSGSGSGSGSPTASPTPVRPTAATALKVLGAAEVAAATARATQAARATDQELARVIVLAGTGAAAAAAVLAEARAR